MPIVRQPKRKKKTFRLPEYEVNVLNEISTILSNLYGMEKADTKALCLIIRFFDRFFWSRAIPEVRNELLMEECKLQYNLKPKQETKPKVRLSVSDNPITNDKNVKRKRKGKES